MLRHSTLRLKASLQRLRRLTHDFSQILMDSLSERAQKLGDALGVSGDISSGAGGWGGVRQNGAENLWA